MRVLVAGSRTFPHRDTVAAVLDGLYLEHSVGWQVVHLDAFVLIEGGAAGADALAQWWATESPLHAPVMAPETWAAHHASDSAGDLEEPPVVHVQVKAQWRVHATGWCRCAVKGAVCKAAGPRRNQQMLDEGHPDLVLAFVDKPLGESSGTHDMVTRSRDGDVPVIVLEQR